MEYYRKDIRSNNWNTIERTPDQRTGIHRKDIRSNNWNTIERTLEQRTGIMWKGYQI